ncbi:hypothetical protein [Candidatus Chloroploca sp. Khr17]|uniref:hypothetical protein n=1 Tax=Candidatus Chloroploca sp. Khr17 TaxID=2496869 RepID=UPI00101DFA9C|nr:hypothetical protein [Candidatus Chloroploca sp. Khr17]
MIAVAHVQGTPKHNHLAAVVRGVILARLDQPDEAKMALTSAISHADKLIEQSPSAFHAKYTRGLAFSGLALLSTDDQCEYLLQLSQLAYEEAITLCSMKGVVNDAMRILRELDFVDKFDALTTIRRVLDRS